MEIEFRIFLFWVTKMKPSFKFSSSMWASTNVKSPWHGLKEPWYSQAVQIQGCSGPHNNVQFQAALEKCTAFPITSSATSYNAVISPTLSTPDENVAMEASVASRGCQFNDHILSGKASEAHKSWPFSSSYYGTCGVVMVNHNHLAVSEGTNSVCSTSQCGQHVACCLLAGARGP